MTSERYQQINDLFHEALERPSERRAEFLLEECGDDDALRLEVERMIVSHEQAGSFLESPAAAESLIKKQAGSLIGQQISHYRILSHIGAGGMGEVYLAEDQTLGRRVAIKLLPAEFTSDRDRLWRFEQEAKAASALNHPNIITIHEIGQARTETGTLNFIAEEFIDGQTLRTRIQQAKQGRLPLLEALDAAAQTANALQVAHAAGIVHRDIKPENLMLRPDGFLKILDFGLAKLTEPAPLPLKTDTEAPTMAKTTPGSIIGTTAYMSPEQARGLEVDERSDLWSLGVVLHEMLAGARPFKGETLTDVIVSIVDRQPPRLGALLRDTPPELERIVAKSLAKNPDERYQTAKDLAIDLKSLKRRLELDTELSRVSGSLAAEETTTSLAAEQLLTTEHAPQQTIKGASTDPFAASPATPVWPRPLLVTAILLALAAIGVSAWVWLRPKPDAPTISTGSTGPAPAAAPERQLAYTLMAQRVRDGQPFREPFEATGRELFEDDWEFWFLFNSPQSGFLYLLNEGPAAKGAIGYQFLFPSPAINAGSAEMTANQSLQTGRYVVGKYQGTERLLLVWSAQPVAELESVKGVVNPVDKGLIHDPAKLDAVRDFFAERSQSKPRVEAGKTGKQTTLRGSGEFFIHTIQLEHR